MRYVRNDGKQWSHRSCLPLRERPQRQYTMNSTAFARTQSANNFICLSKRFPRMFATSRLWHHRPQRMTDVARVLPTKSLLSQLPPYWPIRCIYEYCPAFTTLFISATQSSPLRGDLRQCLFWSRIHVTWHVGFDMVRNACPREYPAYHFIQWSISPCTLELWYSLRFDHYPSQP